MGARSKRAERIRKIMPLVDQLAEHGRECDDVPWTLRQGRDPGWLTLPISVNDRGDEPGPESNFEAAESRLDKVSPYGSNRQYDLWPGGRIKTLMIREDDALAIREADRIISALQEYPFLDEDDMSRREWDSNHPSERECYAEEGCSCEYSTHKCVERIGPNDVEDADDHGYVFAWCPVCDDNFEPFADEYAAFWTGVNLHLMGQEAIPGL